MTQSELLIGCLLAILFGMLGQGVRATVGLKKRGERNAAKSLTNTAVAAAIAAPLDHAAAVAPASLTEAEPFDGKEFAASFAIGAVAGLAAFLGLYFNDLNVKLTTGSTILGIVAAGYSGSDFIEGFVKKHALPS